MTDDIFYLSYSGGHSYKVCPKLYEFTYISKIPVKKDQRSTLFGTAIGKIFEWFYERCLWASVSPLSSLISLIDEAIEFTITDKKWDKSSDPSYVKFLREELEKYIPTSLDIIRTNKILSPSSHSEVDLKIIFDHPDYEFPIKFGGRADFVHIFERDIWIIDGKASQHREKYTDSGQLIWYATQYYLKYHVAPTRLGFFYYRFPEDPIQWVAYNDDSIRSTIRSTFETAKKIIAKEFPTSPSPACNRCSYNSICQDGQQYVKDHRIQSDNKIVESIFNLELY